MVKGIAQSERDNSWHKKHLRQTKVKKVLHVKRLLAYQKLGGSRFMAKREYAIKKMERQREKDIQKGIFKKPSFFSRLFNFKRQTYA